MSDKRRKAARRPRAAAPRIRPIWKSTLLALPIAAIVGLLLLLIFTALLLLGKDPNRYSAAAGLVALYLTAAVGGGVVFRLHGRSGALLCGLCAGGGMLLLFTVPPLFFGGAAASGAAKGILLRLAILPCSILGASLLARKKQRKRRR